MVLSTVEQGIVDLMQSQLDTMILDCEESSRANNLPTDEKEIIKMIKLLCDNRLAEIELMERPVVL